MKTPSRRKEVKSLKLQRHLKTSTAAAVVTAASELSVDAESCSVVVADAVISARYIGRPRFVTISAFAVVVEVPF